MKLKIWELSYKILILSGFILFFFHYSPYSPLLFIPFFLFLVSVLSKKRRVKGTYKLFIPYSSGIFIFVMKMFYWDKFDFSRRVGNLLLISFVFFLYLVIKEKDTIRRSVKFFNERSLGSRIMILIFSSQIIFIAASSIIVLKGVELVGDEPHYLAISQSIAKDGDLNVFNQYARNEYRDFINYRLTHHSKVGKGFKKWYSFHLPGLSFTLAPFFFFKLSNPILYLTVRIFLGFFGSALGVLIYLISLKLWKNKKLSLFVFSVFLFTTPVFFYSIHIFAELQVLLLLMLSLWFALFKENIVRKDFFISGFFLGLTVFWGMKYLIFIVIFSFLFIFSRIRKRDFKGGFAFALFPFLFFILFFLYLYFAYGNFSPMSVYTGIMTESQKVEYLEGMKSIKIRNRIETLFDYFFDQRDGLIPYNPFYLFFFPGLIIAFKKFRYYFPHLMISSASFVYLLYHGYSTVRPGYCPQARYLLPVVWTLMLFSVIFYLETKNKTFKKIFIFIPLYPFFITLFQIFNPFTLYQSTTHNYLDRSGLLFQKLGNIYFDLSKGVPSFVKVDGNFKYIPNIIFIMLTIIFILLSLKKSEYFRIKYISTFLFILMFTLFSLFPRVPLYNPVKVKPGVGLPFLFHGNRFPKTDAVGKFVLFLPGGSDKSVTLSTIKEVEKIKLRFYGNEDSGTVKVVNFNKIDKEVKIIAKMEKEISLTSPDYKRKKGRFYYTINFTSCYCLKRGISIGFILK